MPASTPTSNTGGGLDSLLNGVDALSFATTSSQPPFTVYEKHGLRINFTFPSQSQGKYYLPQGREITTDNKPIFSLIPS